MSSLNLVEKYTNEALKNSTISSSEESKKYLKHLDIN